MLSGFEITGVAAEGKSLGRWNDLVVFVPFGAPGDIATVRLTRKKHSYAEGRIEALEQPSPLRVEPMCEHFGVCGGCKWQHLPYSYQLQCKQQQVADAMQRIAKVPVPEISPIIGSEKIVEYRNKLEYTFSCKKWLTSEQIASGDVPTSRDAAGFHITGAFDKVLEINKCWLQHDISNQVRQFASGFAQKKGYSFYDLRNNCGLMRTMMVRTASNGQIMVAMAFGEDDPQAISDVMDAIRKEFPQITSLLSVVNTKCNDSLADQTFVLHSGKPYIEEEMEGLRFRVGPKSFYQTNSAQAHELYKVARSLARLSGDELVYDLYTGTGTIACFVARHAQKVVGIEYVPEAIDDAKLNASVNKLDNTEFFAGDMKDVLTDEFIKRHGAPQVMIVDPPRAGMHEDVVNVILRAQPQRIVYVSCNPATQARDIALLHEKYDVEVLQPVDMFPHTHHVENVALLVLRGQ